MEATFSDILEAVEKLPADDKEMLVDILNHRSIETRRKEIKANIEESRRAFEAGELKPSTVDEIMEDILS